ncbi:outer membrane protein with beta-barrel domain [Kordia periserrulae]|uniref:Outer membrane protein with beta-barrel domain n=1 Tax=Kordia periserrulae TaxID=701523 RepID=A0A2T6C5H2_9FLAO|nr:outer membrane beta-barrel protein [Kordia periserrulae]PTX63533.1 outer membrane protein with beta-barrel domain [Kordia periserrulae]
MTQKLLIITAFLCCLHVKAQENLSYGVSVGTNVYSMLTDRNTSFNSNGSFSIPEYAGLYIGAYGNYQLNNHFGVVADVAYEQRTIDIVPRVKLSFISISPKVKFDVNGSYNQGFYLKSGLRYSMLTTAETSDGGIDVKEAYKNGLFSLNFGMGTDFANILGLELIFDYSLADAFDVDVKSKLLGAYALLTVDIEKLIK